MVLYQTLGWSPISWENGGHIFRKEAGPAGPPGGIQPQKNMLVLAIKHLNLGSN